MWRLGEVQNDVLTSCRYPPFMLRKKGQKAQQQVWEETQCELESKVPAVRAVYALLDKN
jgi:hypothetical protein